MTGLHFEVRGIRGMNKENYFRKVILSFSELKDGHRFCHECGESTLNTWDSLGEHYDIHQRTFGDKSNE